ncbi:MAG: hypothetical protein J7603_13510 [Pseudacidovorax sp.]|nr:hypothetical protein [Pseudacidovorax sp.]
MSASKPPGRGYRVLGPITALVGMASGAWLSWSPCTSDPHPGHQDLFTLGPIVQHAPPAGELPWPFRPSAPPAAHQCPA